MYSSASYLRHVAARPLHQPSALSMHRVLNTLFDGATATTNQDQDSYPTLQQTTSSSSTPQAPQLDNYDNASWDTRATILFIEAIVLTVIVLCVLIACTRRHFRRMDLASQRAASLQEWAVVRMPASSGGSTEVLDATEDIENGVVANNASADATNTTTDNTNPSNERTPLRQLTSLPSTILSILLSPLRMLDSAINDWSTERVRTNNYDTSYYRSMVERWEREKEAGREKEDERGERLRRAFEKGCMVWVGCLLWSCLYRIVIRRIVFVYSYVAWLTRL
jgi:hypothetical protein